MSHLAALALSLTLLAPNAPSPLGPRDFTRHFVQALQQAEPRSRVSVVRDLELRFVRGDGGEQTVFLDNAFTTYRQAPAELDGVVARYVASVLEARKGPIDTVPQRDRIVPVIKVRGWLEEARRATIGMKKPVANLPLVWEELGGGLLVVYAVDTAKNMAFLTPAQLTKLGVAKGALRGLAVKNLLAILPKIEARGSDGLFMITAGGDYEASLLLADSLWDKTPVKVKGDYVVAIPARDLLLVTGSQDSAGIAKLSEVARRAAGESSYALTEALFVRRKGRFEPLNPAAR